MEHFQAFWGDVQRLWDMLSVHWVFGDVSGASVHVQQCSARTAERFRAFWVCSAFPEDWKVSGGIAACPWSVLVCLKHLQTLLRVFPYVLMCRPHHRASDSPPGDATQRLQRLQVSQECPRASFQRLECSGVLTQRFRAFRGHSAFLDD